ncbi:GapA-binding peptide SR1P [Salinithrix halophila]|uniref:GapA-binding peptide SR1P n=1 Tax=Salinithrix halophila TaxID=1485204 RepID=A0ABV8JE45_9BACL
MEAIICQTCDEVISYVDGEKAGTLYGRCSGCMDQHCSDHDHE